jgi:hypothetical protein
MSQASSHLIKLLESMKLSWEDWHEGVPYAIAEVGFLDEVEKSIVEQDVRAKATLDWRDIELLGALNTISSTSHLREIAASGKTAIELRATRELFLLNKVPQDKMVESVVSAVKKIGHLDDLEGVLNIAFEFPHESVKSAIWNRIINERSNTSTFANAWLVITGLWEKFVDYDRFVELSPLESSDPKKRLEVIERLQEMLMKQKSAL